MKMSEENCRTKNEDEYLKRRRGVKNLKKKKRKTNQKTNTTLTCANNSSNDNYNLQTHVFTFTTKTANELTKRDRSIESVW